MQRLRKHTCIYFSLSLDRETLAVLGIFIQVKGFGSRSLVTRTLFGTATLLVITLCWCWCVARFTSVLEIFEASTLPLPCLDSALLLLSGRLPFPSPLILQYF